VEEVSHLISIHHLIVNHLSSLYTAAPMIDPPSSSSVTVVVGSPLTLSCTSRDSPPDTFTWRKDSGPIEESTSIITVTHTDTSAVFRADYSIDSVVESDRGAYTCTVSNPIGSDSRTIIVSVIGKLFIMNWKCVHVDDIQLKRYSSFSYNWFFVY